jgi:hypothetical protein
LHHQPENILQPMDLDGPHDVVVFPKKNTEKQMGLVLSDGYGSLSYACSPP